MSYRRHARSVAVAAPRRVSPVAAGLAAAAAALAALLAVPAHAAGAGLQVDFIANGVHMSCAAADVALQKVAVVQVSWRCQNSGTRFRCDMTSAGGVYATDLQLVALNCTALTELPAGSPPTLIRASGFESA